MKLNELAKQAHEASKEKGFYLPPRSPLETYALIISEVAEAIEEARTDRPPLYYEGEKPLGEAVECADAIIRLLDYCAYREWDIEEIVRKKMVYNSSRPYKHGKRL